MLETRVGYYSYLITVWGVFHPHPKLVLLYIFHYVDKPSSLLRTCNTYVTSAFAIKALFNLRHRCFTSAYKTVGDMTMSG